MKKSILLAIITLCSLATKAQDSTSLSVTDSTRMYRYLNAYAIITSITVNPPGIINDPVTGRPDTVNWRTNLSVGFYSSLSDFKSGKAPLFFRFSETLFTTRFPLRLEILDLMRKTVK